MFKKKESDSTPTEKVAKLPKPKKSNAAKAAIAALLALVLFAVLVVVERSATEMPATTQVIMAKQDVPAGLLLDQATIEQYFMLGTINQAAMPTNALQSADSMIGTVTATTFATNEVATPSRFTTADQSGLVDPMEVSVAVSSSGYADGGRIRAGDRVNIGCIVTTKDEAGADTKEYRQVLENVYVTAAMDSAGKAAVSRDDGTITTMFSLALARTDADTLYTHIERGNVVIQKVS